MARTTCAAVSITNVEDEKMESKQAEDVTNEAWYDTEIATALAALAKRCHERGMSFVSCVEFDPGNRARTVIMTEDAGLPMQMVNMCAATAPNVDGYIINLIRFCKEKGLDMDASIVLQMLQTFLKAPKP